MCVCVCVCVSVHKNALTYLQCHHLPVGSALCLEPAGSSVEAPDTRGLFPVLVIQLGVPFTAPYITCSVASVASDSLWPQRLWPTRLLCPWNFPGKNTGVGCHFLFWDIFSTQNSSPRLLRLMPCRRILYH